MSLLTATNDDFQGRGRPLPDNVYRVTVEEVRIDTKANGTQLVRRYGNIRTREGATEFAMPDSSTFKIGQRKIFARSWIDHKHPDARRIGQQEIKREAVAAGLMPKPAKGETTELNYDSWEAYAVALNGRDELVRTRQVPRQDASGSPKLDAEGQPVIDVEVVEWLLP